MRGVPEDPREEDLRGRVAALTLEKKAGLLTGADFWTTRPLPGAGLRRLVMSDGPAGVRGPTWDPRRTGLLFPCPSALAATWDVALAERAGRLMGAQARDGGVHVLLAPTVNLHRSPRGGRHFECFSEDPLLTGETAGAFVAGVQSAGVAATAKHYVGNDSETGRTEYDARIPGEDLDALYLKPFRMLAARGVWAVMAAYNKVNGLPMSENGPLLGLLKDDWGFDGVVVSDWSGNRSTAPSALAGLDLSMPGVPSDPWRERLAGAVRDGLVPEQVIDDKVLRLLRLASRVGALEGYPPPPPVTTPDDARAQLREFAARSMVLLRNDGLLPLPPVRRIALLGENAVHLAAQGGGSAHVSPDHVVSPLEGLSRALPEAEIVMRPGVFVRERMPLVPGRGLLEFRDGDGRVLASEERFSTDVFYPGAVPPATRAMTLKARYTAAASGTHVFAASGAGRYELRAGGRVEEVSLSLRTGDPVEALSRPPQGGLELVLEEGEEVSLELTRYFGEGGFGKFALVLREPRPSEEEEFAAAVEAAREADVAVVVVGTGPEVESEGYDRTSLALPGRQDELVRAVAAANPRTVVVVNAGAPVLMPWRQEVSAVLWAWLPGQEGGDALADVLTGAAEPGGRLPTTFFDTEEGLPDPRPVDGVLDYDGLVGYERAGVPVAYPFGHGLGYTTWKYEELKTVGATAEVTLRNTGGRRGREVVRLFLDGRLAGFAVAEAGPGEAVTVTVGMSAAPVTPDTLTLSPISGTLPPSR